MARYADAERRYEQLGRVTDLEARFLLGAFQAAAPDAFLRAADALEKRRAQGDEDAA
ncbi:hypothetical protein [Herbidospora mongoliensis]|uniref:hypothetical protein n=1 Tax=Herbidospora mongoliensis TaxID=688067 RepID=UPI000A7BB380|nr:hypothetical protein [Herbidospora mongoliensis]